MEVTAGGVCHGRARVSVCVRLITGTLGLAVPNTTGFLERYEKERSRNICGAKRFLVSLMLSAKCLFSFLIKFSQLFDDGGAENSKT